jgi:hypothetical protein
MPYAVAHPLAVIPLHRLLGRWSVPSALVIGSVIPDTWYWIPSLTRIDTHSAHSLLFFCLPAGLAAYLAFHLLLKLPLLALLSPQLSGRLQVWTVRGLPRASWAAVLLCLAAGAATHLAWDAVTHEGVLSRIFPVLATGFDLAGHEIHLHQVLQHGSTLLGAGFLAWWISLKLRAAPGRHYAETLRGPARIALLVLFLAIPVAAFAGVLLATAPAPGFGIDEVRRLARAGGVTALSALGMLAMAYCLTWHYLRRKAR